MSEYVQTAAGLMVPAKLANDGLVNVVSGLGTSASKRMHNEWQYDVLLNWQVLDAAYQSNWIARQIVDVPAEDITREWRTIKCEDSETIQQEEKRLGVRINLQTALAWARLYGGGGILMLTGQPLDKPLDIKKVKKGDLQRLIVFDRWDMSAVTLNTYNVLAENFLLPEFYIITGGGQQIHWTHFVRLSGARLPRRQMMITQGWGDSELRKCLADISDMVAAKDGIAELMQEANVDVVSRVGLSEELASDQDDAITDRYALFSQMKSVVKLALLDGDETYERKTLNLSGVAPILETFMTWISGAADIPVTRLFGTSAKGLNATGDGDMNNYHDSIKSKQVSQLEPALMVLDEVMVRSALGHMPDDYSYEWNPLEQMNDVESAQAELLRAQKDQTYLDAGIITQSQVQRRLQSSDEYQFDDVEIEQLETNEESAMFERMNESIRQGSTVDSKPVLDSEEFMRRYSNLIGDGYQHEEVMKLLGHHE